MRGRPGDRARDSRYKGLVDDAQLALLRAEVDALTRELAEERFRHVAGIEREPALEPLFRAHSRAAHRETAAALRESGEEKLGARVASLRAERAAAALEEKWRAAESAATVEGPAGRLSLSEIELRVLGEPHRDRRGALGRAAAEVAQSVRACREEAAERRARARTEVGLSPPWEDVAEADEVLNVSEDAYREALTWLGAPERLLPLPEGDLTRADLRYLLALRRYDGLFRSPALLPELSRALRGLGLDGAGVRLDAESRPGKWLGAHAFESRVSFGRQGGAADWLGLFAAAAAAAAAKCSPSTRSPEFPAAMGALACSLLLTPRFLRASLGVERKHVPDLLRSLAARRLFELRARAAALRVAAESERGLSGSAWHRAHREALAAASLAVWPDGLASRDCDAGALAAALRGAAAGEELRRELTERYDEDFYVNPRTRGAVAGLVAAGSTSPGTERPPLVLAAGALVTAIDRGI